MKFNFDGGDSGSKKCKRGYGGAYGGVWRSLNTGGRFCVGVFGRESGFNRREDVFTYNLLKKGNFINFVISKDNAAINWITAHHKKV
jgi:hypothetical protein